MGEILSAVEVMDAATMEMVQQHLNLDSPIGEYPFYLIIETSGSSVEHDSDKLNKFLDTALTKHFVLNGTVVSDSNKYRVSFTDVVSDCFHFVSFLDRLPGAYVKE